MLEWGERPVSLCSYLEGRRKMQIVIYSHEAEQEQFHRWIDSYEMLAFRQIQYSCCDNYDAFLRKLEQGLADLIIISINGADGMEGVIAARKLQPKAKLIWLSEDKAFGPRSYRLNCTYFAVKPITKELLKQAITCCLRVS